MKMTEKQINFGDVPSKGVDDREELGLDDLQQKFIKAPKVGEEVILDIDKVFKDKKIEGKTKEGKPFKAALTGTDYKFLIQTKTGEYFGVTKWEVWSKIRELMVAEKNVRIKVSIKHTRDGFQANDDKDNYEVKLIK